MYDYCNMQVLLEQLQFTLLCEKNSPLLSSGDQYSLFMASSGVHAQLLHLLSRRDLNCKTVDCQK